MVRVISTKYVKEENLKDFLEIANIMILAALKEKGCINYQIKKAKNHENCWAFLEQWEDEDRLNSHLESDELKENAARLNSLTYQKGEIYIF